MRGAVRFQNSGPPEQPLCKGLKSNLDFQLFLKAIDLVVKANGSFPI